MENGKSSLVIEHERKFMVMVERGASKFCLVTNEPDGAAERLKSAAASSVDFKAFLKNPRAAIDFLAGISLKAVWEALFCPVHGIIGKVAAGFLIVGAGLLTYDHWEAVSGVLEWALPASLLARAGWRVAKARRVAKQVLAAADSGISIAKPEPAGVPCHHSHESSHLRGFFSWKSAFARNKAVSLYKPRLDALPSAMKNC